VATGTFQLGGEIFPKDPLTKTWARSSVGKGGKRKTLFADTWNLTLSFPTLETSEHAFFFKKYIAGGLYSAVLPHPANGKLFSVTGVAIDDYSWTFNEIDNNAYAMNPRMVLSGIVATDHAIPNWFSNDYQYRAGTTIQTFVSGSVATGYTLRFYASGSVAQNIHNKSVLNGDDVRVVWAQDQQELPRDLRIWSANVVEIIWRAQISQAAGTTENNQYYVYYGNGGATNPPEDYGTIYDWYSGAEAAGETGAVTTEFSNPEPLAANAHSTSKEQVQKGLYSIKTQWGSSAGEDEASMASSPVFSFERAEITMSVYIDQMSITNENLRIGMANTASPATHQIGVEIDDQLDIYYNSPSAGSIDTTANWVLDQWNKLEIEGVADVGGTAQVRYNNLAIYTNGTFAGFTDISTMLVSSSGSSPVGGDNILYIDEIKFRKVARVEQSITLASEESAPV
jgi:hypothetical protein